jgi:anti-anti-sigma factor
MAQEPLTALLLSQSCRRKSTNVYAFCGKFIFVSAQRQPRLILSKLTLGKDRSGGAVALNLEISRTGDIVVVRCGGRIVFGEEADELRRVVLGLLNESKRIVVSLASVAHLDSSGVDTLVASFISARNREAEIKFADLSPGVQRVLTSTNVHRVLEIHDSTEEAVKSFYPRPEAAAG